MKHLKLSLTFIFFIIFTGCVTVKSNQISVKNQSGETQVDGKILAAAYQQISAEYMALCYQAYNTARTKLDQFLKIQTPRPKAIMTDIDETILDNSPYQVHQSLLGKDYDPVSWHQWTALAEARPVPGSPAFFQYAASKGVEVFYVTNRDESERKATLQNLKKYNFPYADDAHLKLMSTTSSKVARRDSIQQKYTLIMQFGDNLNDFNGGFEKASTQERARLAAELQTEFGNSYIVIPNPSYGEWENAMYGYKFNLTPEQKDSVYRAILRSY